jgi:protein-tyrosine phosphatase
MPTVLFVCQANMLRSAAAEALARAMVGGARVAGAGSGVKAGGAELTPADSSAWHFASAGVRAVVDSPIESDVATALAKRGIDSSTHRARQLTGPLLTGADLVLTFEVAQRGWASREQPRRARDVLTIRRAHRLLQAWSPAAGDALALLRADRHRYGIEDDFTDPVGRGAAVIAAAVDEIESMLRAIVPALVAPSAVPGAATVPEAATVPGAPA